MTVKYSGEGIRDNTDETKVMSFDVSGVTTNTTRTLTMPDGDVKLPKTDGTSGQVLTSTGTGSVPTWQDTAGGGKVLQVVSTYHQSATQLTSNGGMHELTTSIRLSITPQSATSTLYFDFSASFVSPNSTNLHYAKVYNVTSSSTVNEPPANGSRKRVHWGIRVSPSDANDFHDLNMHTKESSSNTTARTYTIYHGTEGTTAQFLSSTLSTSGGATFPMMFKIMEVEA